jgi:hypothetical protein
MAKDAQFSYLVEWNYDEWQVKQVTGSAGGIAPVSQGIRMSTISRHPANKIIQGDWNWQ